MHRGLRVGSMLAYAEAARERNWGLLIVNPNEGPRLGDHMHPRPGDHAYLAAVAPNNPVSRPSCSRVPPGMRSLGGI